ncbi:hypothetical protein BC829DRAFT_383066 [Chytridium lagenaria]|nr:hypothetical protein BC829DRAFT_383066 [Chytridium lagenaria]
MVNGADEFQLAANANGSSAMFNPVFSLFEGSPKYKQRRRAQSLLSNGRSANRGSVPTEMAAGTGGGMLVHPSVSASPSASSGQSDSEAPRLHICNFDACGKKFKRFEHLRRHMRCHTGERPYVCPLEGCSKGFSRSDNLACHMKVHGFTPEQIAASRSPTPNLHAANTSQNGAPSRHQTPASMLSESPEMAHLHPPSQSNTQNAAFFQEAQHNDSHNFVTYPNDNNHFFHANPQHPNHHQIQNPHLAQQYPQAPQRLQQPNPLPSFMVFPPNHPSSKHHAQQLPSLIVPQYQNQAPPAPQQQTQQQPHPYTQSQMMPPPTYPHQPNATGAPPPPVNVNNMGQNPWAPNANGGDVSFTLPPLTPSGLSPYLTTSHSGAYPLGMPTVF